MTSILERSGIEYRIWSPEEMDLFASRLSALNKQEGCNYTLATCAEHIDSKKYGIEHNRCIDGGLIIRIAWRDKVLMKFLKTEIKEFMPSFFSPDIPENAIMLDNTHYFVSTHKKDPGQCALCGCMAAKDIGEYNTCVHLCEYCYANTSNQSARNNYDSHCPNPYSSAKIGIIHHEFGLHGEISIHNL